MPDFLPVCLQDQLRYRKSAVREHQGTQVIAVSHLAQIAVMSDAEFLIEKEEIAGKTLTQVHCLDENGRLKEVVRLLGGSDVDEFALKHAEELLKQANEYKNSINF